MNAYTEAQWDRIVREVRSLRTAVSGRSVHAVRVSVKRIRAVLRALDGVERIEPLRAIYRACGEVREQEILADVLVRLGQSCAIDVRSLVALTRRRRVAAVRDVRRELDMLTDPALRRIGSALRDAIPDGDDPTSERARTKRIRRLRRRILRARTELRDVETMHRIRRDMKEMATLLAIHAADTPDDLRRHSIAHEAESFLGTVHDEDVLRAWLKSLGDDILYHADRTVLLRTLRLRRAMHLRTARRFIDALERDW